MARSENMAKKKGSSAKIGSAFLNQQQKEFSNELTISLTYVKPNLVNWQKDVICTLQWMSAVKDSQPFKIVTTPDHLSGKTIPLDLDFTFSVESLLSPAYLTNAINHPVIIHFYETAALKSTTKGGSKTTGELLGQACLDILPLFTQRVEPGERLDVLSAVNSDSKGVGGPTSVESMKTETAEEVASQQGGRTGNKVASREFQEELTLEAKDVQRGANLLTTMNKVNLGVRASLHLEAPPPEAFNILSITVESVYNLPPPMNDPHFNMPSLHVSLGLSIPIASADSTTSLGVSSRSAKATASSMNMNNDLLPPPDQNVNTVTFLNGHLESQPDMTYRSKWKMLDDHLTGRAKYMATRLAKHLDDVKYGESVSPGATSRNHVQFNQTYRFWLTPASEQVVRQQIGSYGQWPLEIQIVDSKSTPASENKKNTSGKSTISGFKGKALPELQLPIQLMALVDLTDFLHPGLTTSRVLAEFLPDLSLPLLHDKTGFVQFVFDPPLTPSLSTQKPAPVGSVKSLPTGQSQALPTKTLRSNPAMAAKAETNDFKEDNGSTTKPISDHFHSDPLAIVVRIEFSRPLTEKPEQDTTVHNLLEVIQAKHLYLPDLSRKHTENVRDTFERAIAHCTEIFYAEYEDYEKLRAIAETEQRNVAGTGEGTVDQPHGQTVVGNDERKSAKLEKSKEKSFERQGHEKQIRGHSRNSGDQVGTSFSMKGAGKAIDKNDRKLDDQNANSEQKLSSKAKQINKSAVKLLIPRDFKKYISQSGALTKCFSLLEQPLRNYVRSLYAPDDATADYSVETLSDIHAALMTVMAKVVDNVASSSTQPSSGSPRCGREREDRHVDIKDTTAQLHRDTAPRARSLALTLRMAHEYTAQGHICDARRLLLSRILSSTQDNSNDGTVWSSHAQWSLGQGDQLEAEESLKQSLCLSVGRNALMMLGYVSYRMRDWEKADLYLTSLSYLFESDAAACITLHVYHLNMGKPREAATALHQARVCLATEQHQGGSEEEEPEQMDKVEPRENETRGNETYHKHESFTNGNHTYQTSVESESDDLATLLSNELSWTVPSPTCFGDETSGNNVYLTQCPVLLALNLFEFADTCIGEYELSQPHASPVATYYKAVCQYKQRRYHRSMSHLNALPTPLDKCVPALVLKFHNAYSLYRAHNSRSKTSTAAADSSSFTAPSASDCHRIYESMRKQLDKSEYSSLRYLVILRLGQIASAEAELQLMMDADPKLADADPGGETPDSGMHMLSEAEQILLGLARENDSPLVWYYLGRVYLKQNRLDESELALNEANKLDASFGNAWAGLAMINFALRRPSLFISCRDQASKYKADPSLLETVDKMALLMS